ncbi:PREDICTED: uncharacterized protein At4g15970-like [Camelina sativa]|uniref:Uncharacterized protein At4g15970-like n=1 Tax=Camelina sativa TaxID=90675 RepID=A0ABM0YEB2_CAMSA|nr:PREDICTED: uncharacterized protein At4g15970-like [Camelina sativa]
MIITEKTAASSCSTTINSCHSLQPQPLKQMLLQLQAKLRVIKWIVLLSVLTVLLSLTVYYLTSLVQPLRLPLQQISSFSAFVPPVIAAKQRLNNTDNIEAEDRINLARVLREAATKEKTVIVTIMNQAWAEPNWMFDVFLEGFRIGIGTERLLPHLLVVCLDDKAYTRCLEVLPRRCFFLKTTGVDFSSKKRFMVPDYLKMMWRRTEFLGSLLKLGYNFLFTDMDTIWLRDPFPRFVADADFQIACDVFFNGNHSDTHNSANGGFKFVISNRRTIEFYNYWYESRLRFPRENEQDVLNRIKDDQYVKKLGLKMRFLDMTHVGNFCQRDWDITKVCVMHGNCCIGQDNKVKDLRQMLKDWTNFVSDGNGKGGFGQPINCRRS